MKKIAALASVIVMLAVTACGRSEQMDGEKLDITPIPEAEEAEAPEEPEVTEESEPEAAAEMIEPVAAEEEPRDLGPVYTAYLEILKKNESEIRNYNWQMKLTEKDESGYWDHETLKDPKSIAFIDIYGDSTPELIFIDAPVDSYGNAYRADLNIYTWAGDAAKEMYNGELDVAAGGGCSYALFKTKDALEMYSYESFGDETYENTYNRYVAEGDKMARDKLFRQSVGPDENYEKTITDQSAKNEPITPEEFKAKRQDLLGRIDDVIMYSGSFEDDMAAILKSGEDDAYTYDNALKFLKDSGAEDVEVETVSKLDPSEIFPYIPSNYSFSSGAGAWGSVMTVKKDGTFSGNFHDSNMGESGDGYVATIYECDFSGRFSDIVKVDEYTYSMRLAELSLENKPDESYIDGDSVKHIYSTPYGISNYGTATNQEFRIYLKGAPASSVPEGYRDWLGMDMAADVSGDTMPVTGIYNVPEELGWRSYEPEPEPTPTPTAEPTPEATPEPTEEPEKKDEKKDSGSLVISDSSDRVLSESEVSGMGKDKIQTAVNEIYARHGYIFKNEEVLEYFKQFSWYKPTEPDMEKVYDSFSETEAQNVNLMSKYL